MTIARGATSLDYIMNAEPDQIAHAHVAVDGELNNASSRVRWSLLEPNSDSPDLSFSFSGGFWPSSLPLFHGTTCPSVFVTASMSRSFVVGGGASCCSGRGRFTTRSSHSHCPKADLRRLNPNGIARKVRHSFGAWKEIRYAATELPRGQVPRSTRAIRRPRWQKAHHRYCRAIQGSR